MYYQMKQTFVECTLEDCEDHSLPFIAIISKEEFEKHRQVFDMDIDNLESESMAEGLTKLEIHHDCYTGTIYTPRIPGEREGEAVFLALNEHGILFFHDETQAGESYVKNVIRKIKLKKKWRFPCIERFIYDFLEEIVSGDLVRLERYEKELDQMEDDILSGQSHHIMERLVDVRSELLDLYTHYDQLVDFAQELEENENHFFEHDNLRLFHLFFERATRLQNMVNALREHTMQVRDLYQFQLEAKQNRTMSILTVVATIFMPLTLLTGWYGMNFKYMPELEQPMAYPGLIGVCICIILGGILFFKKKKLL